jgi:hypothetical protein
MVKAVAQRRMLAKRDGDKLGKDYHAKICGDSVEGMKGSTSD